MMHGVSFTDLVPLMHVHSLCLSPHAVSNVSHGVICESTACLRVVATTTANNVTRDVVHSAFCTAWCRPWIQIELQHTSHAVDQKPCLVQQEPGAAAGAGLGSVHDVQQVGGARIGRALCVTLPAREQIQSSVAERRQNHQKARCSSVHNSAVLKFHVDECEQPHNKEWHHHSELSLRQVHHTAKERQQMLTLWQVFVRHAVRCGWRRT